jgi:hypothetical protein
LFLLTTWHKQQKRTGSKVEISNSQISERKLKKKFLSNHQGQCQIKDRKKYVNWKRVK